MKNHVVIIGVLSLLSCQRVCSQTHEKKNIILVDSVFSRNLTTLDSVANGYKRLNQLTNQQSAFLYTASGWASLPLKWTYAGVENFTERDLNLLKAWYAKYSMKIDAKDLTRSIEIFRKTFETGFTSDTEMGQISEISKKYTQLKLE